MTVETRHAKYEDKHVVVVTVGDGCWYASITMPIGEDDLDTTLFSGVGDSELQKALRHYRVPENLEWLPGGENKSALPE